MARIKNPITVIGGARNLQSKTVTPTAAGLTVTPDSGYDALSSVAVNGDNNLVAGNVKKDVAIFGVIGTLEAGSVAKPEETKSVALDMTTGNQVVTPSAGKVLTQVTVQKPATLIPSNIKADVSIGGVTGSYTGSASGTMPTLRTVSLSRSGNTLTISNPSSNGTFVSGYKIYDNGTLVATQSSTSYNLLNLGVGVHSITVKAYGTNFNDSASSSAVSYSIYSITNALTNLTSSNSAVSTGMGTAYSATLAPVSGKYLPRAITVTMGGKEATFTYNNVTGAISIASVTGNVVITAVAADYAMLSKPTIAIAEGVLSWAAVTNATTYSVRSAGVEIASVTALTFDITELLTEEGGYNLTVVAQAAGYQDSDPSNSVSYYVGVLPVYSVSGEGASSPTLTRGDGAIGLGYTVNANGTINSDFDNCMPWSGITQVTDSAGNVFMRIPKHYTRYSFVNGLKKTEICANKLDNTWLLNPIFTDGNGTELDYVDIGKYTASGSSSLAKSVSGASPLVNININSMRTACRNNGTGYQQFDIWAWVMLQDLFKVEFATLNSQSIMYGYANGNSVAIASGTTDNVATASGSYVSNTDGKHAMKYRGIENLWGNVYQWLDGISVSSLKPYVCQNPASYTSGSIPAGYTALSYNGMSGGTYYTKAIGYDANNPFAQVPSDTSGSNSTYYCDYGYYSSSSNRVVLVGGGWGDSLDAGAWYFNAYNSSSITRSGIGGRLLRRPL